MGEELLVPIGVVLFGLVFCVCSVPPCLVVWLLEYLVAGAPSLKGG